MKNVTPALVNMMAITAGDKINYSLTDDTNILASLEGGEAPVGCSPMLTGHGAVFICDHIQLPALMANPAISLF